MCSNYTLVTDQDRLLAHFGVSRPADAAPPESTFPGLEAFFIRAEDKVDLIKAQAQLGFFGLLPEWSKDLAFGRHTYNCKSETMRERKAFKAAWFAGQRCIIPLEDGYEWCHETGDPVRWRVKGADGAPLAAAGLWGVWIGLHGEEILSFTMLTVSGEGHALYSRFNAKGEEKRMPVFIAKEDQDTWLNCPIDDASVFIRQAPVEWFAAEPAPAPWKPLPEPAEWEQEPDMFADEWRSAAVDPTARALKARRGRPKPKVQKADEPPPPESGDLFG